MFTYIRKKLSVFILGSLFVSILACSSVYYSVWEAFGQHKRDLLRSNVIKGRDQQVAVQEELRDALEVLRTEYGHNDTKLSVRYDKVQAAYDDASSEAESLNKRIKKMNSIAEDLFEEWQGEADGMGNARLKSLSLSKLSDMKRRYGKLRSSLSDSQNKMMPVLKEFEDHVLYMKHSLNSEALGTLANEARNIEADIQKLVSRMDGAIQDTDSFLKTLEEQA